MRRALVACVLFVAAGCARARHEAPKPPDLALFYGSDLRGSVAANARQPGGLARRATSVDRARLSARAVVQVDAGDLVPTEGDGPELGAPLAREARARLLLGAYRRMGVDAITVGERELAFGAGPFRALCAESRVPVVAANVQDLQGRPLFSPTTIIHAGGIVVGVLGVVDAPPEMLPAGVVLGDPVTAARAAVRSLRAQGAELVVGLFHVAGGLARARQVVAGADGVDIVVLGHAGPAAPPRYLRAGAGGVDLGRLDVHGTAGQWIFEDHLVTSSPDVPEQPGVRLLVRLATAPVARTFTESVAALSKAAGAPTFGEGWTYGSTALCVGCHPSEAAQWATTDHAHAFATLERAGRARDPACLGCHVTGFLSPGGPQSLETATQFSNVGCEACHGPSVRHVTSTNKHRGTSRAVSPMVCLGCHTPDQNVGEFSIASAMKEVVGPGHGAPAASPR